MKKRYKLLYPKLQKRGYGFLSEYITDTYVNLWVLKGIAVCFSFLKINPIEFSQCAFLCILLQKYPESLILGKHSKIL